MKVISGMLVAAAAALVATGSVAACELRSEANVRMVSSDKPPDADNTGRNVRDRDDRTRTPTDQGGSDSDRNITAHIRRDIVANDALSTNAHNVKIITTDGIVTLRGPVKTVQEKTAVAAAAQRTPGVKRVDNQLEIERTD